MELYTKCNHCNEELYVIDMKDNNIRDGVYINNKILCKECMVKEQEVLFKTICESYNLDFNKCKTYTKDNTLYLAFDLGYIDRDYYGANEYTLVINTITSVPSICLNDYNNVFSLEKINNKNSIKQIIELVKFMCT